MKGAELSDYAHSEQAYQFIRSCLERCLELHPNCVQPISHGPTRLIDVGSSYDDQVRLVETRPESYHAYIALSYCWGDGNVVRTLFSNYEEFKKGIPTSTLPRTIQDAIIVTRNLGQRYLWVDALCIIQDSKSDWETVSANMGSIYRSSLLTLAAATAASTTDGFLNQGHIACKTNSPFKQTWYDALGNETILAARVVPDWNTHTMTVLGDEVLPLNQRGWTLQERKLSTRIVMYRPQEIWWYCLSETSCECHIIEHIPEKVKEPTFNSIYSAKAVEDVHREWQITVGEYSQRELKFPSDKLPAIAGIAKALQSFTGSTYLAGLWEDDLYEGLTWAAGLSDTAELANIPTSPDYIGPTFSWVSVNRPVRYQYYLAAWTTAKQCQLLAAQSSASGLNPLGHVESGYLTISAPLLDIALIYNHEDSGDFYPILVDDNKMFIMADVSLETFERENEDGVVEKSVRRSHIANSRAESGTPVSLLYLGYSSFGEIATTKYKYITRFFLVLGKCPADMTRYERIGIVRQSAHIHQDLSETPPLSDRFTVQTITIV